MRQSERARIAAQGAEPLEQRGVGRACEQGREQRIFLRARGIDLVDVRGTMMFGIKVGTKNSTVHSGRRLDRQNPLRGNARPVGHRWLRNAYFARKRAHAAGSAYGFVETRIPHGRFFFLITIQA